MSPDKKEVLGYIDVLIECPFCGGLVPDDFECLKCRSEMLHERTEDDLIYACSVCRKPVDESMSACPNCKTPFE